MSALAVAAVSPAHCLRPVLRGASAISTNVAAVAIASQLSVPFATLLSVALLGEVVHWRRWSGIVLSFAGVLVMGFDPSSPRNGRACRSSSAGAFVGSVGLIGIKKLHGFRPLELQAWIAWLSLPVLLVLSLELERPDLSALAHVTASAWAALAFTALGGKSRRPYGIFLSGAALSGDERCPVTTLSPVFSVLLSVRAPG